MNFGKYRDQEIADVPREYLDWLFKANEDINAVIRTELERRDALESDQMSTIERIVHAGYRDMARKAHPDAGGTNKEFQDLRAGYEQLKVILTELRSVTGKT